VAAAVALLAAGEIDAALAVGLARDRGYVLCLAASSPSGAVPS
jgi:hypothetical protein